MSAFKEWKEWNKDILYLINKPIKILEIGIGKGEIMKYVTSIFNNKLKYYGIDEWKYGNKSKDIEKIANLNRNLNKYKKNIFYLKKNSKIILYEFIKKNTTFDFIIINSSYDIPKNILYTSVLAMELINPNGVILFNDYIKFNKDSAKKTIDAILSAYKNDIEILYIGNQILIKKIDSKSNKTNKILDIINNFITLLSDYWKYTEQKLNSIHNQSNNIPEFNPKYDSLNNIIYSNNSFEIFKELNIEHLCYKYSSLDYIKKDILKNLKFAEYLSDKNTYNSYYNLIKKSANHYQIFSITNKENDYGIDRKKNRNLLIQYSNIRLINNTQQNFDYINLSDLSSYSDILDRAKIYSDKYKIFSGNPILNYPKYNQMYSHIILQTLLLKHVLDLGGLFKINIDIRNDIVNDYLILLNYIFDKVYVYQFSNKIGRISIKIHAIGFIGIANELYNKLSDILYNAERTNNEIVSLFNSDLSYINIKDYESNVSNITNNIITYIENNKDTIIDNIDKINNNQKQITINDFVNSLINKRNVVPSSSPP